jgi:hypothetical protein
LLLQRNKEGDNSNVAIAFFVLLPSFFCCNGAKKAMAALFSLPSSFCFFARQQRRQQ